MPQIVKLYLLGGSSLMGFVFCATSPIIQIYFISLIDSSILAMANIITTGLAAVVNASVQSNKLKDFYRHHKNAVKSRFSGTIRCPRHVMTNGAAQGANYSLFR